MCIDEKPNFELQFRRLIPHLRINVQQSVGVTFNNRSQILHSTVTEENEILEVNGSR